MEDVKKVKKTFTIFGWIITGFLLLLVVLLLIFGLSSIKKGILKISVNETVINNDLYSDYSILSESIQTILRRYYFFLLILMYN